MVTHVSGQFKKNLQSHWFGLAVFFILAVAIFTVLLHTLLYKNPFGADFYTFWLAGRAIFINHTSPYNPTVTLQSQLGIYKRVALPDEDQLAFAYPPYSLLAILPTVFLNFDWAQSLWLAVNLLFFLTVCYSVFATPKWASLAWLGYYPLVFGLILGNFAVSLSAIILLGAALFQKKTAPGSTIQVILGIILAWSTIKPQFIWLYLIIFLLLALARGWRALLYGFAGGFLTFLSISFIMVPGWVGQWLNHVFAYAGYVRSQSLAVSLLSLFSQGVLFDILISIVFVVCLVITLALFLAVARQQLDILPLLAWCGFFTYLFHPHGLSYEQLIFIIPFSLWVTRLFRENRLLSMALWFAGFVITWLSFFISQSVALQAPFYVYALWIVVLLYKYNCSHVLRNLVKKTG